MKNSNTAVHWNEWFTIDTIDADTYIISEYRHPEETHSYLLIGTNKALLIDTGLGICNIYDEVLKLTDKPIIVASHVHWDHIGGHKYFPTFYVHRAEVNWINGSFPLPLKMVHKMVIKNALLPKDFDIQNYEIFQGAPAKILDGEEVISLGNRTIEVIHTPVHSPGHLCFWEESRGYLFTGDLVYKGTLFCYYPSTDPNAYLSSLEKIAKLPTKKVFPGHHSLDIEPELILRMRDAFLKLKEEGKLHHDAGTFDYGDWKLWL